jgi:hypothetical protein
VSTSYSSSKHKKFNARMTVNITSTKYIHHIEFLVANGRQLLAEDRKHNK